MRHLWLDIPQVWVSYFSFCMFLTVYITILLTLYYIGLNMICSFSNSLALTWKLSFLFNHFYFFIFNCCSGDYYRKPTGKLRAFQLNVFFFWVSSIVVLLLSCGRVIFFLVVTDCFHTCCDSTNLCIWTADGHFGPVVTCESKPGFFRDQERQSMWYVIF